MSTFEVYKIWSLQMTLSWSSFAGKSLHKTVHMYGEIHHLQAIKWTFEGFFFRAIGLLSFLYRRHLQVLVSWKIWHKIKKYFSPISKSSIINATFRPSLHEPRIANFFKTCFTHMYNFKIVMKTSKMCLNTH